MPSTSSLPLIRRPTNRTPPIGDPPSTGPPEEACRDHRDRGKAHRGCDSTRHRASLSSRPSRVRRERGDRAQQPRPKSSAGPPLRRQSAELHAPRRRAPTPTPSAPWQSPASKADPTPRANDGNPEAAAEVAGPQRDQLGSARDSARTGAQRSRRSGVMVSRWTAWLRQPVAVWGTRTLVVWFGG